MECETSSLWALLGGDAKLRSIIDQFVTSAIADPRVNYSRGGRYPLDEAAIKAAKVGALHFISAATGGPYQYAGRSLQDIHRGMRISNAEFDAIASDFKAALATHATAPDLVGTVMERVEATRSYIIETTAGPGAGAR